ncbi:MAG: ferredoxin [Candidatus Aenigmatarchaeota archaeon]|nr:ferredoxin [Candidatus Aenigmarchaeota archaeon]
MPTPKVDRNKCIGCGACVSLCPDVFELGPDGKSRVKNQKGKCDLQSVVDTCPVGAISLK